MLNLRPGWGGTKASRAAVGLQYLFGPASENLPTQQSSLARFFEQKKGKIQKKTPPNWKFKSALGVCKMFKATQHVYDDDDSDDDDGDDDDDYDDDDEEEEEDEDDEDEDEDEDEEEEEEDEDDEDDDEDDDDDEDEDGDEEDDDDDDEEKEEENNDDWWSSH